MQKKIGIVIVSYKRNLEDSEGYRTIKKLQTHFKEVFDNIDILIINNHKEYKHKNNNVGFSFKDLSYKNTLLDAYLFAINFFLMKGINWTLFLDHDTELSISFLRKVLQIIQNNKNLISTGLILPYLISNSKFISPCYELRGGIVRPRKLRSASYILKSVYAVGSGMVVNNEFFQSIINKNVYYKIDFLDRYICELVSKSPKNFLIVNEVLNHNLSVLNLENEMNVNRYEQIVHYEHFFMKHERSGLDFLVYKLRIIKRILIFLLNRNLLQYTPTLFKSLFRGW